MNILFPVGGRGERFQNKFKTPKPLVEVNGKTLLQWSIETLGLSGQYIFVVLEYQEQNFNRQIENVIKSTKPESIILKIKEPTLGSAFTCLVSENYINNDDELVVTNCDQYLNWDFHNFVSFLEKEKPDAAVSIYDHGDIVIGEKSPYCFVKTDSNGNIIEFREKFAISDLSMNGIHYWKRGTDFVRSCKQMITNSITVNGEYYLSGSFNFLISEGSRILPFIMKKGEFYSLGTPEDIEKNIENII
jgi:NDP-sugar pyrophosphorylase family protein